jgi:hypothetical protein
VDPEGVRDAAPGFSITRKTSNQTLIEGGWTFDRLDHLEQRGLLAGWPQAKPTTRSTMRSDDPAMNQPLQDFAKETTAHPCGSFQRRQLRLLPFGRVASSTTTRTA